eukprot:1766994-Amphidinium_carterae.1
MTCHGTVGTVPASIGGHTIHTAWRRAKTGLQKWSIQALAGDGVWTQTRLHSKGLAVHRNCKLCGAEGDQYHRLLVCGCMSGMGSATGPKLATPDLTMGAR